MSSTPHEPSSLGQRVNEAIAAYLRKVEGGEAPDREKFLAEHADIAAELRSFFADRSQFRQEAGHLPSLRGQRPVESGSDPNEPTLTFEERGLASPKDVIRYFGDYELLEEISRGGMGIVFKARQVKLNRIVAVKMILAGQFAGPADVERFRTEAEAAAKLDHPGIVPIYEVGQHEGQHYFSMGFVDGLSLSKRVAEGPLPEREAAEIVRAVAEAVQYAHEKGVIHRDLKPGNVLLDKAGKPRVTDFGLAKLTESGSDLTGTGQVLGTPSYMPPEQAAAQVSAVGRLSDVYSLGAILYCLLTGRPPFQAATPIETLFQVQRQEPVSPCVLNPGVPLDLGTIVLKCLDKSPSRRYGSAAALAEELQRYLEGRPILARPVGRAERFWRWCRREPVVAGLSAGVAAALVVGTFVSAYYAVQASKRANEKATLAESEGRAKAKAQELAITNGTLAAEEIRARKSTERQLRISTAERLAALSYTKRSESPELALLLAVESGRATREDEEGLQISSHQALIDALDGIGGRPLHGSSFVAAISPDGRWAVTGSTDNTARIWNLTAEDTGDAPRVLKGHEGWIRSAVISSDGRWVVTGSADRTARLWDMQSENPGANPRVLRGHQDEITTLAISPDGRRLVTRSGDMAIRIWDLTAEDPGASPHVLGAKDLYFHSSLAISSDSRWLVTEGIGFANSAFVWDLTAENPSAGPHVLRGHLNLISSVAISPDGHWIVTGSHDGTTRIWDLTARNPGSTARVLGGNPTANVGMPIYSLAISPDSRRVVTGIGDGTARVWDLTAEDPGARPRILNGHQGVIWQMTISSDSRWLLTGSDDRTTRIWDLAAENPNANPRILRGDQSGFSSLAISPDNRWVITAGGGVRIWDLTAGPRANPHVLSGHQREIRCVAASADGCSLVTGSADGTARVWDLTSVNPGTDPRILKGNPNVAILSAAISADGRWIVTGGNDSKARVWDLSAGNRDSEPRLLTGHRGMIHCAAISPDDRWVVTGSTGDRDPTARIWDLSAENPSASPRILSGHEDGVSGVTISPDSRWVVTEGRRDPVARIWKLTTDDTDAGPRLLHGHQRAVTHTVFSADGRRVVTAGEDNTARIWDVNADDPSADARVFRGRFESVANVPVAISSDGRWLVRGGTEVHVWDLAAENPGEHGRLLNGASGSVAISPDGGWLFSGGRTGPQVWALTGEDHAATPRVLNEPMPMDTVSSDGRWIISGSDGDTIRIWRWQWNDLMALAQGTGRNFTREEWEGYFRGVPYRKTFPELPIPDYGRAMLGSPDAKEGKNLLKPTADLDSWRLALMEPRTGLPRVDGAQGRARLRMDGDCLVCETDAASGEGSHFGLYLSDINLQPSRDYVVRFQAKASEYRDVQLIGGKEDGQSMGLGAKVILAKSFQPYAFRFRTPNVGEANCRIGFYFEGGKGTLFIKDMSLSETKGTVP